MTRREHPIPVQPRLRLCLASMSFAPVFGGAALRFFRYVPGFRKRGVDVEVVATTPAGADAPPGAVLPPEDHDLPVHRVAIPSARRRRRFLVYFSRVAGLCRGAPMRPDVLHLLNLHPLAAPWLWRVRRAGIAVVYSDTLISRPARRLPARIGQRLSYRIALAFVDVVVTSTSVMRDWLRSLGVRGRIEVIPNGVDVQRFRPPRDADERAHLRAELGFGRDEAIVLTVGAVEARKRVHLLLEAWQRLGPQPGQHRLVVVGPVSDRHARQGGASRDDYARDVRHRVEALGEAGCVTLTGEREDVERFYRAADLFVLTTEREGMNNAIFEAMASRLPVLTVPFLGIAPEHGRPEEHFARCPAAPDALARSLAALLADVDRRALLAEAGLAWAREHMDVERVLDRQVALYRELCGHRPA